MGEEVHGERPLPEEAYMVRVLVVGAGEIGSRHLQALVKVNEESLIFIYEPNTENLKRSLNRVEEEKARSVSRAYRVEFIVLKDLSNISLKIDIAIISTNSKVRRKILDQLIGCGIAIENIILEKLLFNRAEDYREIPTSFGGINSNVYCNQWMSSSYPFMRLKQWIGDFGSIQVKVSGSRWGLESNAVHFIDYFDFLFDRKEKLSLKGEKIVGMSRSKRPGCVQLFGEISISAGSRGSILLESFDHGYMERQIRIQIATDVSGQFDIDMSDKGTVSVRRVNGGHIDVQDFNLELQSNLTQFHVSDLMTTGECKLPRYSHSMVHHLLLIDAASRYFLRNGISIEQGLPIT